MVGPAPPNRKFNPIVMMGLEGSVYTAMAPTARPVSHGLLSQRGFLTQSRVHVSFIS
jgi:hypothetical protein